MPELMAAGMAEVGPPAGSYWCSGERLCCAARGRHKEGQTYDGGVEPGTGESPVCPRESLLRVESSGKVGLCTIVHALDGGRHGANRGRKGEEVAVVHDELFGSECVASADGNGDVC